MRGRAREIERERKREKHEEGVMRERKREG